MKKCKECQIKEVLSNKHKYCSIACRNRNEYKRFKESRRLWQERKRGEYKPGKLKCKICGKWYVQVGSHIVQKHKITARVYRELMNLPVRRGITPTWFKKLKGEQALKNGTYKNLKNGSKCRFTKDDPRTRQEIFWKSHRYKPDVYYQ